MYQAIDFVGDYEGVDRVMRRLFAGIFLSLRYATAGISGCCGRRRMWRWGSSPGLRSSRG